MKQLKPRREFPVWLLVAALLAVLVFWNFASNNDSLTMLATIAKGIVTTVLVTLVAFALALVLGLVLGFMRISSRRWLREIATFYVEIVRGIPILVILYYIAFVGAPGFVEAWNWCWSSLIGAGVMPGLSIRDFGFTERAVLALSLAYASFLAEVIRGGLESIPHGQMEAALALGMTRRKALLKVVFPQAFRSMLPALGNDFVAMIKDSALVSALGVQDLTQIGKVYASGSFKFFETYNVVAFLYLTLTLGLSLLIRLGEQRMKQHLRPLSSLR